LIWPGLLYPWYDRSVFSGDYEELMRKANSFLLFVAAAVLVLGLILLHAHRRTENDLPRLQQLGLIVEHYGLTDLCLATDARYTRHPSQADWHTSFQSHPMALDHFPSGSLIRPPARLRKIDAPVD
jgi:hypothetical protein